MHVANAGSFKVVDVQSGTVLYEVLDEDKVRTGDSWMGGPNFLLAKFAPQGGIFATAGGDNAVKIWDTETGVLSRTLTGHTSTIRCLTWSLDGSILVSASMDHTCRVWVLN